MHIADQANGKKFTNYHFKLISLNKMCYILIQISTNLVAKVSIDNDVAFVQVMVWRRPGDKPLIEPKSIRIYTSWLHQFLSYTRMEFNYLSHVSVEERYTLYQHFNFSYKS